MKPNFKPLDQQVMVITGASSGIGLATARAAAREGVKLVLAARNDDALTSLVAEISSAGGDAIHVAADVGIRADVERIAQEAIARFGTIDTWVNNAGISLFGRLSEVSDEDNQRLFQTNFWGVVYGSLVAVRHLRQNGGALINLGSVLSDTSVSLQGMYSASKHAVKGFTDALRIELLEEDAPVSVTLIKPTSIDTPFPQHARNYMDREPTLPPPLYRPEEVAKAILFAATHAKRDIMIGSGARAMSAMNRATPGVMDRVAARIMSRQQKGDEPPREPEGALHRAGVGGRTRGDSQRHVMRTSVYTRASMHPMVTGALLGAAGVAAVALYRRRIHDGMGLRPSRLSGQD